MLSVPLAMNYTFQPEGPQTARIAVVCEKPARDEVRLGRLLVGPSGSRVRRHLARAGIHAGDALNLSKEVWLTNAVQSFDSVDNPTDADVIRELPRLYRELTNLPQLRCIIGMGAIALKALSNFQHGDITNRRGSRLVTPWGGKFIPTFHPAFYMRGEWRFEPVVQFDIQRAIEESQWSEIRLTERNYYIRPSLTEAHQWLTQLATSPSPYLSFDIETTQGANGTWYISCIAFATTPTEAYCIPITKKDRQPYWPDLSTECSIWRGIATLLNSGKRLVSQNGCAFDAWQLRRHGVTLSKEGILNGFDTFSAHSLLAPDLPHDLGFIVSIYTDEPYYKDESGRGQAGFGQVAEDQFWLYNCKDAALTLESALAMIEDMRDL